MVEVLLCSESPKDYFLLSVCATGNLKTTVYSKEEITGIDFIVYSHFNEPRKLASLMQAILEWADDKAFYS